MSDHVKLFSLAPPEQLCSSKPRNTAFHNASFKYISEHYRILKSIDSKHEFLSNSEFAAWPAEEQLIISPKRLNELIGEQTSEISETSKRALELSKKESERQTKNLEELNQRLMQRIATLTKEKEALQPEERKKIENQIDELKRQIDFLQTSVEQKEEAIKEHKIALNDRKIALNDREIALKEHKIALKYRNEVLRQRELELAELRDLLFIGEACKKFMEKLAIKFEKTFPQHPEKRKEKARDFLECFRSKNQVEIQWLVNQNITPEFLAFVQDKIKKRNCTAHRDVESDTGRAALSDAIQRLTSPAKEFMELIGQEL